MTCYVTVGNEYRKSPEHVTNKQHKFGQKINH